MKTKVKCIARHVGALTIAAALFLSASNSCMVFAAASAPTTTSPIYGLVTTNSENLLVRQTASPGADIVGKLEKGSLVMIVGEENGFYRVMYHTDGYYGYASKEYISATDSGYYLRVNDVTGTVNIRKYNNINSEILYSVPKGTYLAYVYIVGDWYRCVYANVYGCISMDYATKYIR